MRTLIAIPVYNEAKTVESVLRTVRGYADHVLAIDDGSTDDTAAILNRLRPELGLDLIRHEANAGYGRAMREAFARAHRDGYDWVITMDCDEQHEPASIPSFIDAAKQDDLDIVSGSRYLDPRYAADRPPEDRRTINKTITAEINAKFGFDLTDAFCGFKAHRVSAMRQLRLDDDGYAFPMQLWAEAKSHGLRIGEIPVRLIYNDYSRTFGGGLDVPEERLRHYRAVLDAAIQRSARLDAQAETRISIEAAGSGSCCGGPAAANHKTMPPPAISISPGPDAWRAAMGAVPTERLGDRALLGLPTDRPIVMSGHQPVLWHAGILTKLLAASELAKHTNASVCWIIADMDEVDPTTVRVPHGSGEHTQARTVRTLAGGPPAHGVPTGALPPREAADDDGSIEGFAPLLDAYGFEPTLAMQVGRAVVYLACERFGIDEPVVISCSDLIRTDAWQTLIDAMRNDPAACVDAYNRGVEAHPEAHMRPMQSHKGRYELPLWRVRENMARLAVFSDQLASIPANELRPRALAMTALVRAALCELFVHGTGGGVYDRITDDWFSNWSSSPGWQLAPTAVATADAYADFGVDPGQLPDPARAKWRAHHARHDPAMLGDSDAAADKRRLVERIASIKDAGGDPSPVFTELQSLLTATRERRADRLAEFDRLARDADRLAGVRRLALDRTWPWPTLSNEILDALHATIRVWFQSVPSSSCTDASSCSR